MFYSTCVVFDNAKILILKLITTSDIEVLGNVMLYLLLQSYYKKVKCGKI